MMLSDEVFVELLLIENIPPQEIEENFGRPVREIVDQVHLFCLRFHFKGMSTRFSCKEGNWGRKSQNENNLKQDM